MWNILRYSWWVPKPWLWHACKTEAGTLVLVAASCFLSSLTSFLAFRRRRNCRRRFPSDLIISWACAGSRAHSRGGTTGRRRIGDLLAGPLRLRLAGPLRLRQLALRGLLAWITRRPPDCCQNTGFNETGAQSRPTLRDAGCS